MKKLMIVFTMVMTAVAFAAPAEKASAEQPKAAAKQGDNQSSAAALTKARSQITDIIKNPKLMASVMKTQSAADQVKFVGEVNRAIDKMSGSINEKAEIALVANRSALDGAAKGNLGAVVAEVYATAPLATLTVINESFAQDVFNRAANPKVTYTDEQYIEVAKKVMNVVVERLETATDAGVRGGFAALMMIRASNTESDEIKNAIIETLPKTVQKTAKEEWIPAATATGDSKSYEPMLGMADSEVARPVVELVLRVAAAEKTEALLADLNGASTDPKLNSGNSTPMTDASDAPVQNEVGQNTIGDGTTDAAAQVTEVKKKDEVDEPWPYQEQTTH